MSAHGGTVVHAYGLVARRDDLELPPGIAGCPVQARPVAELCVLLSVLDADEFGPQAWEAHSQDLEWVRKVVTAHHGVLQQVVEQGDVLPLRIGTMHSDEESLVQAVERSSGVLGEALAAIRGHVEVGVKVYATGGGDAAGVNSDEQARPSSGREYLTRRSEAAAKQRDAWSEHQAQALRIHEELALNATHALVSGAQDPELSGRREPMLLNASYLVPRGDFTGFVESAERLTEEVGQGGLVVECTGPWPAYSFVDLSHATDLPA